MASAEDIASKIPTLSSHAVSVLWDGESAATIDATGLTDMLDITSGTAMPNANDMRKRMLEETLRKQEQANAISAFFKNNDRDDDNNSTDNDGATEQKKFAADMAIRMVIDVVSFMEDISGRGGDNIMVTLKTTSLHGQRTYAAGNEISLLVVDDELEHFAGAGPHINVIERIEELLIAYFKAYGFYIQDLGTAGFQTLNREMLNTTHQFRVSWHKPGMAQAVKEIQDVSQIDAWIAGVPLEDILA